MKYISLFAGIGGFDLALNRLGHECVYANDFDKYCKITYDKNFKHKLDTRSITSISTDEIPDHDLLVGGFPCQSFSIAGKRGGFDDTRGTLFFDIARILKEKHTRYFILENVKGLLSHDNGRTFKTIISTLVELGYDLQWQVLNSKNFGVPQNRERIFIVGNIRGDPGPQIFPVRGDIRKDTRSIGKDISPCLDANYYKGFSSSGFQSKQRLHIVEENPVTPAIRAIEYKHGDNQTLIGTYRTYKDENEFRIMKSGLAPTIQARTREDGSGQPVVAIPVLTPDRMEKRQNGRRFKTDGDPSFTLTAQDKHGIYDGMKIRRLTPIECERLQGFPDGWTEGVSDSQRYKQLGNAVTVNVVEEIMRRFI